jgi:PPOX class probable F420-dependent enzyme
MDDRVRALFEAPNFAHVATLMPDGAPHSVPVWIDVEGEHIAFFTQPASRKARNLENDPRVGISIVARDNPYRNASVRGRVVRTLRDDEALATIDRIAHKYTGRPFPMRSGVAYLVAPEHEAFFELPFEDTPA